MARADGAVIIEVDASAEKAQKELDKLNRKIEALKAQIKDAEAQKMPLLEKAKNLGARLDAAKEKLEALKNSAASDSAVETQEETVKSLQYQFDQTLNAVDRIDRTLDGLNKKLESSESEAGIVANEMAEAAENTRRMAEAERRANEMLDGIGKRLKTILKRALVFAVISKAMTALRNWASDVIKASPDAAAALSQLKGALLTLAQPLVQVLIPALTSFLQLATALASRVAEIVSAIAGTTAQQSADAAKALYDETEALDKTGSAAKKASKSLASFDTINKLSSNQSDESGSIAPDFSYQDSISERLKEIAKDVLTIAAGFALWKVSGTLTDVLGKLGFQCGDLVTKIAGVAIAIGGLKLLFDGLSDAWKNGFDWGNLLESLAGAAALAVGLYIAFGKVGAGIGLIVAGAALIVTAFKDICENGATLQNVLALIAGIVATGLGFSLLTGSTLPLVIAGIASVVVAVLALTGNLEEFIGNLKGILEGIVQFITGVFTGDLEAAFEGLKKIFKNLINADLAIIESFINLVIKGLNWLISQINKISFDVPSWVPNIGGKSLGFNIPAIQEKQLPRLAEGRVIPANHEFMAILGDQKSGTNIETPLSTMVQAFKQALSEYGGGGQNEAYLVLDDEVCGKLFYRLYNAENNRVGVSLAGR